MSRAYLAASFLLTVAACGGDDDPGACAEAVLGEADSCCPAGANANSDEDCEPTCGNGEVEDGEECDDGGTTPGDGCDEQCVDENVPPTAYRIDSLSLRDPHLFAFGALDVTDMVNTSIAQSLTSDDPPNGLLDLSLVLVFRPLNPTAASSSADAVIAAACTAPAEGTSCSANEDSSVVPTTATNGDGACLVPLADTTGDYQPAVESVGAGRCFATDQEMVEVEAGGVLLRLNDTQVGANYGAGDPAAMLTTGLFFGFMTEADADATLLPADLPVVGGEPLSSLLQESDKDTGPGGESGWYFYFNFGASTVPFTE